MGKSIFFAAISLVLLIVASYASNVDVDVLPTPQNSNSIHSIIQSQRRHVLFNSRRLEGDCISTCIVESKQPDPTPEPVVKTPVPAPVTVPVPDPVPAPVPLPTSDCTCYANDPTANTFKCANTIYVCPGYEQSICENQESENAVYYSMTDAECATMRTKEIDDECIGLSQHTLPKLNGLSNRVCYDSVGAFGTKNEGGEKCEHCTGTIKMPELDPVPVPVTVPEPDPVPAPVPAPTSDCTCNANDPTANSFKCGKKIYVCPDLYEDIDEPKICSNEVKNQFTQYKITAEECAVMRTIEIEDKCILLERFGVTDITGLGLSHRVCYDSAGNTRKTESRECGDTCSQACGGSCNGLAPVKSFKDLVNKR